MVRSGAATDSASVLPTGWIWWLRRTAVVHALDPARGGTRCGTGERSPTGQTGAFCGMFSRSCSFSGLGVSVRNLCDWSCGRTNCQTHTPRHPSTYAPTPRPPRSRSPQGHGRPIRIFQPRGLAISGQISGKLFGRGASHDKLASPCSAIRVYPCTTLCVDVRPFRIGGRWTSVQGQGLKTNAQKGPRRL
jgi:hypothetical protein